MLQPSDACVALAKDCEGFRARPYLCPAGVPTIGYGSTFYPGGRRVTMQDPPITELAADTMLRATLATFAQQVRDLVRVPMTQGQFDALDFTYNLGAGKLASSTLLIKLNAGDYAGAAREFDKWVMAGGKPLPGLVKRRAAERQMFEA